MEGEATPKAERQVSDSSSGVPNIWEAHTLSEGHIPLLAEDHEVGARRSLRNFRRSVTELLRGPLHDHHGQSNSGQAHGHGHGGGGGGGGGASGSGRASASGSAAASSSSPWSRAVHAARPAMPRRHAPHEHRNLGGILIESLLPSTERPRLWRRGTSMTEDESTVSRQSSVEDHDLGGSHSLVPAISEEGEEDSPKREQSAPGRLITTPHPKSMVSRRSHGTFTRQMSRRPSLDGKKPEMRFRIMDREGPFGQSLGHWHLFSIGGKHREVIKGVSDLFMGDWYHAFLDTKFYIQLVMFLLAYVLCFALFAVIYLLISKNCDLDLEGNFVKAYLLSLETMMTIGYGVPDPFMEGCLEGAIVLTVQSLLQLMMSAFLIGVIFQGISRPQARACTILFSERAVIRCIDGAFYFMMRVCDLRLRHSLIEAHVRLYCVHRDPLTGFKASPMRIEQPDDDLGATLLLALPSLVIHRIDAWSPLGPRHKLSTMPVGEEAVTQQPPTSILKSNSNHNSDGAGELRSEDMELGTSALGGTAAPPETPVVPTGSSGSQRRRPRARSSPSTGSMSSEAMQLPQELRPTVLSSPSSQPMPSPPLQRARGYSFGSSGGGSIGNADWEDDFAAVLNLPPAILSSPRVKQTAFIDSVHDDIPQSDPIRFDRQAFRQHKFPGMPQRQVDGDTGNRDTCVCPFCGESFNTVGMLETHCAYNEESDRASGIDPKFCHRTLKDDEVEELSHRHPRREEIEEHLAQSYCEVVVLVEGIEPTTSSTLQARHSYVVGTGPLMEEDDISWDMKFVECCKVSQEGGAAAMGVDLGRFHTLAPA